MAQIDCLHSNSALINLIAIWINIKAKQKLCATEFVGEKKNVGSELW